ncbi:NADH-quinone oxidoreductase subunit M [Acidithiobacillus montserratensis]|uniref:NADH-quinone oxidoreductase subunit M n=1 Tax=Acidithiobacillus montserratensis TaxID=2729135 RepID=A0ACD5HFT3_9PROT|nr:NADH-quinone oxidoreductase subunit M [Acidithiobacillaceae bacterium]MBU2748991.1 NADH-quinone oxidoreductase subunit M [Acidithiobacillus montserratensis]
MILVTVLILLPWCAALWLSAQKQAGQRLAMTIALIELLLTLILRFAPDSMGTLGHGLHIPYLGGLWTLHAGPLGSTLALLCAILIPVSLAFAWRLPEFRSLANAVLVMAGALFGIFYAQNVLMFYIFYEILALAGAFLILRSGHKNRAAALQFLLYTFVGSLLFLVALVVVYVLHGQQTGVYDFSILQLADTRISAGLGIWLFLGMVAGLAVKMPLFPLHSWAASGYGHAAPAGSVFLSGAAVTAGAYGLIHFAIPMLPQAALEFAPVGIILGAIGTLYGAFLALNAANLRLFAAWASVSHMNLVALGLFALQSQAIHGSVFLLIAHGVVSAGLFGVVSVMESRGLTGEWAGLGGLFRRAPRLGAWMLFFFLAGMGLPGLANFPGEFLSLAGAFRILPLAAALATLGILAGVVYFLRAYERIMLGPLNHTLPETLQDLQRGEWLLFWVLGLLTLWLGLDPQAILSHLGILLSTHSMALIQGGGHGV